MKKLTAILILLSLITLAACGQQTTTQGGSTATGSQSEPSGRDASTNLTVSVEGQEEDIPASLYTGDGWSVYVPDNDWIAGDQTNDDGSSGVTWENIINDDVEFGVLRYSGLSAAESITAFVRSEDDYLFEDLTGGVSGDPLSGINQEDDGLLCLISAENGGSTYIIWWKYPAEAEEGYGARLLAITDTFALS